MSAPAAGSASQSPTPPTTTRSEADSKAFLQTFGIPFPTEHAVATPDEAVEAAEALGYPVVAKLNGDQIAHKTERGLVRLQLGDAAAVSQAATELLGAATPDDGDVTVLVAPMLRSSRELIAGIARDPQFGPTIMVGVGGVLAEAIADVSVRLVPIGPVDAAEMLDDLAAQPLLGPFRGEPALDRLAMVDLLCALSAVAQDHPSVRSVDLNPLLVVDGRPVAVDALVEVEA